MSYVESRNLSSLVASLTLGTPPGTNAKVDWMIGSSMGRELKAITFTIDSTLTSLDLDWQLIHPETNQRKELILLQGRLESLTSGEPFKQIVRSGTLGYHEPLFLRFLKSADPDTPFSADSRAISEMLVTIEYEPELMFSESETDPQSGLQFLTSSPYMEKR
jgi:hypothetical protein